MTADMDRVVSQTVQQLGAQVAMLTLELNAVRAELDAARQDGDSDDQPTG